MAYVPSMQKLIDEFGKLPGIGPKSAQRITYYLLKMPKEDSTRLADSIKELKERVRFCDICFYISESKLCSICLDSKRDNEVICVVEEPRDVIAIEKTRELHGKYHVLGGVLSPLDGVGPDQLHIKELLNRLKDGVVKEVIVCTNPNVEGDAIGSS